MVSALETRINNLRKEQEQVKADIAMIEARLKKAAVIEAKILTIISSPSRLSSRQIEKLEKEMEAQIKVAESTQQLIDELKKNPQNLNEEQIRILQYQVKKPRVAQPISNDS